MNSPLNLTSPVYADSSKIYAGKGKRALNSIFNGSKFYYRPTGSVFKPEKDTSDRIHQPFDGDDIYNVSPESIINFTSRYKSMTILPVDFAYLKNLGVYPNNRMIVARRYPSPVRDNLFDFVEQEPLATLISWIPDGQEEMFSISFGEEWVEETSSLKNVLNDILKNEFGVDNPTDGLPLPGFTAGLQVEIMKKLGFTDQGANNLPSGNPNLIQQAMRRKTLGEEGGSGLKTDIAIKMSCEWEQKFYPGVDPTIVFLDIIANVLRFSTSSSNFLINGNATGLIKDIVNDFKNGNWDKAIITVLGVVIDVIKEVAIEIGKSLSNIATQVIESNGSPTAFTNAVFDELVRAAKTIGTGIVSKYRVKLNAVIAALDGSPSAPWHVTIGNPKKPIFCSGDMYISEDVTLSFGNILAFNDLPSTFKIEFTLKNGRPLGAQEIFEKFNTGAGRSYEPLPSAFEKNVDPAELARLQNNIDSASTEAQNAETQQQKQTESTNQNLKNYRADTNNPDANPSENTLNLYAKFKNNPNSLTPTEKSTLQAAYTKDKK